jgi:hypothetical protein
MRPLGVRVAPAAIVIAVVGALGVLAQSLTLRAEHGVVRVGPGTFSFIKGQPLGRLKDGRSVRFDFDLVVQAEPGARSVAQARESFILSYDLWEERFAVTHAGTPARSASHLTARDAEAWCLDRLAVPVTSLAGLGRDRPLWIRLEYRVPGDEPVKPDRGGLSLGGLIDRLSRRAGGDLMDAVEAGPFMLTY